MNYAEIIYLPSKNKGTIPKAVPAVARECRTEVRMKKDCSDLRGRNPSTRRTAKRQLSFRTQEQELLHTEETITPEQFFVPAWQSSVMWTGERRLLLAVIEEAIHSFLKYRDARTIRGQRLFRETQEWFWSPEQDWLYSFESICQHLHLDPDYIRRGLQRWQHPTALLRLVHAA